MQYCKYVEPFNQKHFPLGKAYDKYKKMATIKVNDGPKLHYGDVIKEVDAGCMTAKVTIPPTYGSATFS